MGERNQAAKIRYARASFLGGDSLTVVRCRKTKCGCNRNGICEANEISVGGCEFPSQCRTDIGR